MPRFFIPQPDGYQIDQMISFPDEMAHQIRHVLRMESGNSVVVLDNVGSAYEVVLTAVTRQSVTGRVQTKQDVDGEPAVNLTLFQSLTKRDKFEWILQKGTELGVTTFVPVVTNRSIVQDCKIKPNKLVRWQKIVTEAAEQSQRGRLPVVQKPQRLQYAFADTQSFDLSLIAWVAETNQSLSSVLNKNSPPKHVALFIGPEGGFSEGEIENGRIHNIIPFTMGKRILRTETAAIVASTLVLHELGELA
jgi:16S rRNA (uracil1498-N3)-methyltransferase